MDRLRLSSLILFIIPLTLTFAVEPATAVKVEIPATPTLMRIPTAETLGDGGYQLSLSMIRYRKKIPQNPKSNPILQKVVVGDFFKELHSVSFEAQSYLVPLKLCYGISNRLDLDLGVTLSTDQGQKIIEDYYEVHRGEMKVARVYRQPIFDVNLGFKYIIKPEMGDGLPSLAVGATAELGYTGDDRVDSAGQFVDDTPADGFPFFGMGVYLAGTEKLNLFKLHSGVGAYSSSKLQRTADSLMVYFFGGAEVAFTEQLFGIGDVVTKRAVNSSEMGTSIAVGLKYLFGRPTLNAGFGTAPELILSITSPGRKAETIKPAVPGETEAPLF